MLDQAAFLRAIAARPGDPLPRLVFADWLDERGEAAASSFQRVLAQPDDDSHRLAWADAVAATEPDRAEFVKAQVELARSGDPPATHHRSCPRYALYRIPDRGRGGRCKRCRINRLRQREESLVTAEGNWLRFSEPLGRLSGRTGRAGEPGCEWEWEHTRGFVSTVVLPWERWSVHADTLLSSFPLGGRDGRVVLVTAPPLGYDDAAGAYHLRAAGRRPARAVVRDVGQPLAAAMLQLLAEEYGVQFDLRLIAPADPSAGLAVVGNAIRRTSPRRSSEV